MTAKPIGLAELLTIWAIAFLAGILAAALLLVVGGWEMTPACFVGGAIFLVIGLIVTLLNNGMTQGGLDQAVPAPKVEEPTTAQPAVEAVAAAPVEDAAPAAPEVPAETSADIGEKPEGLAAAREGGPDNLKEIKGVGPKLENLLHSMGYFHFDQIAAWTAKEVAWVDENLEGFKGRVTRDEWVSQAKILASGEETEFSERVDEGKVY